MFKEIGREQEAATSQKAREDYFTVSMQQRIPGRRGKMWKSAICFSNVKLLMTNFVKAALTKWWKHLVIEISHQEILFSHRQ